MEFYKVKNKDMLSDCFKIRQRVFVDEQHVPLEHELDEFEELATHVIGYDDEGKPVGCGRFRAYEDKAKIERVAILKEYRNQGIGYHLMQAIEAIAKEENFTLVTLNAQVQAQPFYEKLGYSTEGTTFLEENIEHIKMSKNL